MIDDPEFAFLFRLAWTLKKSVQEILSLPEWERECWRDVFLIYGPLDWKRSDLLTARVNQYQAAGDAPLGDFVLFKDPSMSETKQSENDLLKKLGWNE